MHRTQALESWLGPTGAPPLAVEQGQFDAAIAVYRMALAADPKHVQAHNDLAVALMEKGDDAGALAELKRASHSSRTRWTRFEDVPMAQAATVLDALKAAL